MLENINSTVQSLFGQHGKKDMGIFLSKLQHITDQTPTT